jgi:hypothetical protein
MSEFREGLDELIETAKDHGYDKALGQCGTETTALMVEQQRAKVVALHDARTELAIRAIDMLHLIVTDCINTKEQSDDFNALMAEGKRIRGDDKAKTECYLEDGTLLWEVPYGFRSMFKVGQDLIENHKRYIVISAEMVGKTQYIIVREEPE